MQADSRIKLRCSGQSNGCNRCKMSDRICVYATTGSDKRSSRAWHQSNGINSKACEASEAKPGPQKTFHQPAEAANDIMSSTQNYTTKNSSDQTIDAGLDDNMLAFGEELNLSEQMFSELVSDYVTPNKGFDFGMRPFAFPKDNGPESLFPESQISGRAMTLPDDGAGINSPYASLRITTQWLMNTCRKL